MTGNYNLYFSITKEDFKNAIPDSLLGKEALALEMGIIKRDTTKIPVREILFTDKDIYQLFR